MAPSTRNKPLLMSPVRLCLMLALAGLTACANLPSAPLASQVPPAADAPAAKLLLRASAPANHGALLVQLEDSEMCLSPKLLVRGMAGQEALTTRIHAGRLTTLDFVLERPGQSPCFVRWSFTPEAGKSYLVQGLVVGAGCTARLLDTSRADRPLAPADLLLRSSQSQRCLPLASSTKAGGSLIQGGQRGGEAVLRPDADAKDLQGLITP